MPNILYRYGTIIESTVKHQQTDISPEVKVLRYARRQISNHDLPNIIPFHKYFTLSNYALIGISIIVSILIIEQRMNLKKGFRKRRSRSRLIEQGCS